MTEFLLWRLNKSRNNNYFWKCYIIFGKIMHIGHYFLSLSISFCFKEPILLNDRFLLKINAPSTQKWGSTWSNIITFLSLLDSGYIRKHLFSSKDAPSGFSYAYAFFYFNFINIREWQYISPELKIYTIH